MMNSEPQSPTIVVTHNDAALNTSTQGRQQVVRRKSAVGSVGDALDGLTELEMRQRSMKRRSSTVDGLGHGSEQQNASLSLSPQSRRSPSHKSGTGKEHTTIRLSSDQNQLSSSSRPHSAHSHGTHMEASTSGGGAPRWSAFGDDDDDDDVNASPSGELSSFSKELPSFTHPKQTMSPKAHFTRRSVIAFAPQTDSKTTHSEFCVAVPPDFCAHGIHEEPLPFHHTDSNTTSKTFGDDDSEFLSGTIPSLLLHMPPPATASTRPVPPSQSREQSPQHHGSTRQEQVRQRALALAKQRVQEGQQAKSQLELRLADAEDRRQLSEAKTHSHRALTWELIVCVISLAQRCSDTIARNRWQVHHMARFFPKLALRVHQKLRRVKLGRLMASAPGGHIPTPTAASLRTDKLLNLFSEKHINALRESMTLKLYFPREYIVYAGCEEDEGFIMHDGTADVLVNGNKVFTIRSGMIFGTVGMISGEPRTASIQCQSPCLVWSMRRRDLDAFGRKDNEMVEALRIIAELRESNVRSVYKGLLAATFFGSFPLMHQVSESTLSQLLKDGKSRVMRPGTVLVSPYSASGSHAARYLVLRGLLRVFLPSSCAINFLKRQSSSLEGGSHQGDSGDYQPSLEEHLRHLVDQPGSSRRMNIVITSSRQDGGNTITTNGDNGGIVGGVISSHMEHELQLMSIQPRRGTRCVSNAFESDFVHVADVTAPALLNVSTAFLHDNIPFSVEAVNGCDALEFSNALLRSQDVLDLATMRQNAYNTRLAFIQRPTRQQLFDAMFTRSGGMSSGLATSMSVSTRRKVEQQLDALKLTPWVFVHGDSILFDAMHDLVGVIVVRGSLHLPIKSSSDSSTAVVAPPDGSAKAHTGGSVPLLFWPSLPLFFLGSVNRSTHCVSDVEAFKITRCDFVHWLTATLKDDEDLHAFIKTLIVEFDTVEQKHAVFSDFGLDSYGEAGGDHPNTTSANGITTEIMSSGGSSAMQRVQTLSRMKTNVATAHLPRSLTLNRLHHAVTCAQQALFAAVATTRQVDHAKTLSYGHHDKTPTTHASPPPPPPPPPPSTTSTLQRLNTTLSGVPPTSHTTTTTTTTRTSGHSKEVVHQVMHSRDAFGEDNEFATARHRAKQEQRDPHVTSNTSTARTGNDSHEPWSRTGSATRGSAPLSSPSVRSAHQTTPMGPQQDGYCSPPSAPRNTALPQSATTASRSRGGMTTMRPQPKLDSDVMDTAVSAERVDELLSLMRRQRTQMDTSVSTSRHSEQTQYLPVPHVMRMPRAPSMRKNRKESDAHAQRQPSANTSRQASRGSSAHPQGRGDATSGSFVNTSGGSSSSSSRNSSPHHMSSRDNSASTPRHHMPAHDPVSTTLRRRISATTTNRSRLVRQQSASLHMHRMTELVNNRMERVAEFISMANNNNPAQR